MDTKRLHRVEVKDADQGIVEAVFSTFGVVDADGDVTLAGAFDDGAEVPISAYGHMSWSGALPVGKGVIKTSDTEARIVAQFFMDTEHGADTFKVVKGLGHLGQWSYGYDPLEFTFGELDSKRVRFLKRLKVHETSPVLVGAGVGTRTLAAKSAEPDPGTLAAVAAMAPDVLAKLLAAARPGPAAPNVASKAGIGVHETDVVSQAWSAADVVAGIPDDATAQQLRSVFAWVDGSADPTAKSSYRFPHHHGVGGAANVRACVAGIAALNGARGGSTIPDDDRKAVYDHLAAHLRDADREPPELRHDATGDLKFSDEGAAVLAAVNTFTDRVSEVMALRARKGKGLAPASLDLLAWTEDELQRLRDLLSPPATTTSDDQALADDELRTLMAAVARVNHV